MAKRGRKPLNVHTLVHSSKWNGIPQVNTNKRTYTRHSKKGRKLIGPNGRIYKENVRKLANKFYSDFNKGKINQTQLTISLDELVATIEEARDNKKTLTDNGYFAKQAQTTVDKYLANMGKSRMDMAEELSITEEDIPWCKWEKRGNATVVITPDGRVYNAVFAYNNRSFFEVI